MEGDLFGASVKMEASMKKRATADKGRSRTLPLGKAQRGEKDRAEDGDPEEGRKYSWYHVS